MRTQPLYYDNPTLTDFSARIVQVHQQETTTEVILDRTAFYPEGGGQPADRGFLAAHPVLNVQMKDGVIVHVVDTHLDFQPGVLVQGTIDPLRRWDHSQQHSAQHILSRTLQHDWDIDTLSFHLGSNDSTIDVSVDCMSSEQLRAVEDAVNDLIRDNAVVQIENQPLEGKGAADGPKNSVPLAKDEPLRRVNIGDAWDQSYCCGTHVRQTVEIGGFYITETSTMRQRLRIHFIAGERLLGRLRRDEDILGALQMILQSNPQDFPSAVGHMREGLTTATHAHRSASMQLAELQVDQWKELLAEQRIVWVEFSDDDLPHPDYPDHLLRAMPTDQPWILVSGVHNGQGETRLSVRRSEASPLNMRELLPDLFRALGGRGGGAPHHLQGIIPTTRWGDVTTILDPQTLRSYLQ